MLCELERRVEDVVLLGVHGDEALADPFVDGLPGDAKPSG